MIAKRAHRRKDSKSSFSTLVEYITRDGKAAQKDGIEYSRITHCGFDTLDAAILEIEATQARNTRSKIDKTYHLIVSFQEDEIVGQEKLFDIEDEICRAIGLGDHQRISAAHQDTDNQHIHIAINKIHPISHLAIEPYYDYMKLDEACAALEFKHELYKQITGLPTPKIGRWMRHHSLARRATWKRITEWIHSSVGLGSGKRISANTLVRRNPGRMFTRGLASMV